MAEHLLFLTGRLAEPSLRRVLEAMQPTPFHYEVRVLGLNVAALMTADLIERRLERPVKADRVLVPGRCRGDLEALGARLGVPVARGPDDLKDLPEHFGRDGQPLDFSRYDIRIFAEIVDAPQRSVAGILERADRYRRDGADVIDLGCLPDTPFPHLEEAVEALHAAGHKVSVDSVQEQELLRGGRAGADYLLSLHEQSLWIAEEVASTPVLIPAQPGDLDSLARAMEALAARGRPFLADPVLDPLQFGFTDSLVRYHTLRRRFPEAQMLMGVGNLTELTDADTGGMNALLLGIATELGINAILTTEVSPHARSAVREADAARRLMYRARADRCLPKGLHDGLLNLHGRKPFPDPPEEIAARAAAVRDPNYRVQVSEAGIHIYNRDGLHSAADPFALYPKLGLEQDGGHAFYLGVELARAQIALQLGKRYVQDEELTWGAALPPVMEDRSRFKPEGTTLATRKKKQANGT